MGWLEYKKDRGHRLVSQTTNPKKAGELWNKPKASTYTSGLVFMFLDEQGHVSWTSLCAHADAGKDYAEFAAKWASEFDERERQRFEAMEKISRKVNPTSWAEWDAQQAALKTKTFRVASVSSNTNSFGLT